MYLLFFLLLFSSGISSCFLTLKETLHLEKKVQCALIDEIICFLKAEKGHLNMSFSMPCHLRDKKCACKNINMFIEELKKMDKHDCMKAVEEGMKELQKKCSTLEESSHCSKYTVKEKQFSYFKEHLEEFLKWFNEHKNCSTIIRDDSGLYQAGNCTCHKPWKYPKGLP